MRHTVLPYLSFLFLIHSVVGTSPQFKVGAPLKTTSGIIQGHAAADRTGVSEYLGIPFAQPPVGELRFAAPVKYESSDTIDASTLGPICPQIPSKFKPFPGQSPNAPKLLSKVSGAPQSEDCLTLNLWIKPQTGETKKAALVFIYGGGFSTGGANNPTYNGEYFADEEDIAVVTFNYRINIFGFPGLPGFGQNNGLLDQRLAIEWVHENADALGIDSSRITIVGESAGSASVDLYSYAYTDDLVAGFIEQSGTATSFQIPAPNNFESWYQVSEALGCGGADVGMETSIACVQGKDYQQVLQSIPTSTSVGGSSPFYPTVDNTTVFDDYPERSIAGKFTHKPYLFGSNNNEAGFFNVSLLQAGIPVLPNTLWEIMNLAIFTCSAANATAYRAQNDVPVWRYRYFGDWQDLRLFDGSGAYHAAELPVIFGTTEAVSGVAPSQAETRYSEYMRHAWATFVRDPERGLSQLGWPAYNPSSQSSQVCLAPSPSVDASKCSPAQYDALCPAIGQVLPVLLSAFGASSSPSSSQGSVGLSDIQNLLDLIPDEVRAALPDSTAAPERIVAIEPPESTPTASADPSPGAGGAGGASAAPGPVETSPPAYPDVASGKAVSCVAVVWGVVSSMLLL